MGCWGHRGCPTFPEPCPQLGTGVTLLPTRGAGPRGAHPPPHKGFLRAGWVPGSGFGTNNGSPGDGSPGPRGSLEQALRSRSRPPPAQAGEHVRPPQPTAPAALLALAQGGCWQLLPGNWAQPPQIPEVGAFLELAAVSRCAELRALCRGHLCLPSSMLCPCSVAAWWVQPSLAGTRCAGCWQPPPRSPCCTHGPGSGSRERFLRCLTWRRSGVGMLSQILSNVGCFLGAAHLWESTGEQGLATPVISQPHSFLAGRHRAAGPPRTHSSAPGHHAGPPRVCQGAAEAWR